MGERLQPDTSPLPVSGRFPDQQEQQENRQAGQFPPVDWGQMLAFEPSAGRQTGQLPQGRGQDAQPDAAAARQQVGQVGDQQKAAQVTDRAARPVDQAEKIYKMEDGKTAALLLSFVREMRQVVPEKLTAEIVQKAEAELGKGEFGPGARAAYSICARTLSEQVSGNLILLNSRGVEIPAGCPLEPPVDPRSGRHIMPEWFRAKVQSGDLRLNLQIADDAAPSAMDVAKMRAAGYWTTKAVQSLHAVMIDSELTQVKSQLDAINVENRLKGWYPDSTNMSVLQREQWTQAAREWLNTHAQVRNYAQAIAQLHLDTTKSAQPDKLFGIPVPKWSTLPRQIFPDEALKDENFPGKVDRNPDGSIKALRIDMPETLDRNGANLEKMRKLEAWLEKYAPQVEQLMNELTLGAAKEGRVLAWGDAPCEGVVREDGWNVVINKRVADQRGGFVEVPIRVLHCKTEKEAEDTLKAQQELLKNDIKDGKLTIAKEVNQEFEESKNPGFLLGGRNLKPNEKEVNLREARFTAKEVTVDGQPMIEVTSTVKLQYSWLPYDIAAKDVKTTVSGTTGEPVRYKPDDWLVVIDGNKRMLMQARFLPQMEKEEWRWHYGMKGANMAMDGAFLLSGGIEGIALYRQAAAQAGKVAFKEAFNEAIKAGAKEAAANAIAKQAEMQAAKLPLATALKVACLSQAGWHMALGATGVGGRTIEAGFGKYGHDFMKYRSWVMLADITWNQLWIGDMAKKTWAAARGTALTEKVSISQHLMKSSDTLGFLYRRNGNLLLGTEFLQVGEIVGRGLPSIAAEGRADDIQAIERNAKLFCTPVFSLQTPTLLKLESLVKEGNKVRNLPEGTKERRDQEKAMASDLTAKFLDGKTADDKLAAALALLNLKGKENKPAPEVLGTRMRGQTEDVLKLADVQQFLKSYQQQQMRQLLSGYDTKLSVGVQDLSLKRTADMLALPESNADRVRHLDKLVETYKQFKTLEDKVKDATVALEKARQEQRYGAEQSDAKKLELAKAVTDATDRLNAARMDWDKADKKAAVAAAIGLIAFGITDENGQGSRALKAGALKSADLVDFLERQFRAGTRSDARYVAGDMLFRMGRVDMWQLGSLCQDILRDNRPEAQSRELKTAAMLQESSPRIGELLELMRYQIEPSFNKLSEQKDRAQALAHAYGRDSYALQETLRAVLRDQTENADVRAMAGALLLACSAPTSAERQALFASCREEWQKCGGEPGRFARQFVEGLKSDLAKNTDAAPEPARQQLLDKKFRAALALSEMGGPAALGIDAEVVNKTTQALIDCFDFSKPALSLQVLPYLVPDKLASLTPKQLKDLRDTSLQILGPGIEAGLNTPDALANAQARNPLRAAILDKLPQIMQGAPEQERAGIINAVKAVAMFDARYQGHFAASVPELRAQAVVTLSQLVANGTEAAKADAVKLAKGLAGAEGTPELRDNSAEVRLAALKMLSDLRSADLQAVCLKLLKSETDPRVIEFIWSLEYKERRCDVNSPAYRRAFEDARRKLLDSVGNSSLNDGKEFLEALCKKPHGSRTTSEELQRIALGNGPEAVLARRAAAYVLLNEEGSRSYWAGQILALACQKDREKSPKELANLVERCLLSESRMDPVARVNLLIALDALKPGSKDSPVTKEDAAVIYATVLERDLKHMPRYNVPENPLDARTLALHRPGYVMAQHRELEAYAIEGLKKYGSEKVIPLLDSLAEDNIDRDRANRATKIVFLNGKSREFIYEGAVTDVSRNLTQVIEQPSGEVWTRGEKQGDIHVWTSNKGGKRELRAAIVNDLDEYIIQEKDGTIRGYTVSGAELVFKNNRLSEVNCPNGTGRKFTCEEYEPFRGVRNVRLKSVTEMPSGEIWTRDDKDERKWTSNKGGSRTSASEFVTPCPDRYGGAGGDPGSYCRVTADGMEVYTSSGAKLLVKMGMVTVVDSGFEKRSNNIHSTHPIPEIRRAAKEALETLRDSTSVIRSQVEEELRLFPDRAKKAAAQQADDMAAVLSNPKADSAAVCKAIYMNCLTSPIASVEDPRRIILQQALKDAHEQVRLAAARMLFEKSDLADDRRQAVAVLANIEKNGSRFGYYVEASTLLSDVVAAKPNGTYHAGDANLVADARKNAVDKPQIDAREHRRSGDAVDDTTVAYQRAFEQIKVQLEKGPRHSLVMDWDQWNRWFVTNKLDLLEPINMKNLQEAAARRRWEGHKLEWRTSSWETIRREEAIARQSQVPALWAQFNQLVNMARTLGDKDQTGIEAREALVYIVISGGASLSGEFRKEAVEKAAAGILDICKGKGPGRGDLDGALSTMLIEQRSINPAIKFTLVKALDELVAPKGSVTKEFAANVALLALESEYRNMPSPGEENYDDSVKLQIELIERIKTCGNKEMVPVLEAVSKHHPVDDVKKKAAAVSAGLK